MTSTMEFVKAARWWGRHDVRVEDVGMPELTPDQALVRVTWAGLCGSDLEEFESGPIVVRPGTVLGHEVVGEVVRSASNGSGPGSGTSVVVDVVLGCGTCFWCLRHEEGQCATLRVLGQSLDGGLAEYVAARADRLIPIPAGLAQERAVLAEPLAVAVRAVRAGAVGSGTSVVVLGGGTIGNLTAQVARHAGALHIVVIEPDRARRDAIEGLGLAAVWHPEASERATIIAGLLPEQGADVVLECAGRPGVAPEAIRLTRRGGRCVLVGVPVEPDRVNLLGVVLGEKTIVGSAAHMWDVDVAVAVELLASNAIDVGALVTHVVPLDDVADAFRTLADPAARVQKMLVDCRETVRNRA